MAEPTQPISPLRQRMIEDMTMRKLAPKTQASYICAVKKLADYLGHSSHTATAEDLRKFQLHLTDTGTSRITINTTITALRFFFEITVGDRGIVGKLKTVPVPRKLPVVLSRMIAVFRIAPFGLFYYWQKPVTSGLGRSGQNDRFVDVINSHERSALASESDRVASE